MPWHHFLPGWACSIPHQCMAVSSLVGPHFHVQAELLPCGPGNCLLCSCALQIAFGRPCSGSFCGTEAVVSLSAQPHACSPACLPALHSGFAAVGFIRKELLKLHCSVWGREDAGSHCGPTGLPFAWKSAPEAWRSQQHCCSPGSGCGQSVPAEPPTHRSLLKGFI